MKNIPYLFKLYPFLATNGKMKVTLYGTVQVCNVFFLQHTNSNRVKSDVRARRLVSMAGKRKAFNVI